MSIHFSNSRPIAQVVTRRHPLSFSLYMLVFLLGLIFILHWYGTGRTEKLLFPGIAWYVIFAWKWMMLTGGGGALVALMVRPRVHPHWPDLADLLHLEGIAAIVAAFGLGVYLIAIVHLQGFPQSSPVLCVYTALIAGLIWRGVQAVCEGRMLEDYTKALTERAAMERAREQ